MASTMNPQTLVLKDIHLPAEVGAWPPALGWWGLMLLTILVLFGFVWVWRWLRQVTVKKQALQLLNGLESNPDLTDQQKLQALSRLLRRVCISRFPRQEVAGLTGESWLTFLDQQWNYQSFSSGAGRCLVDAPYQADTGVDIQPMFELCRHWLKALPRESS